MTLRRIGIIGAAGLALIVVIVGIIDFGVRGASAWNQLRTRNHPVFTADYKWLNRNGVLNFEKSHSLDPQRYGGLRVHINDFNGWTYFISVQRKPGQEARGAIYAYRGTDEYQTEFSLDGYDTKLLLDTANRPINDISLAWQPLCFDGSGLEFESWSNHRAISGSGNAACVPQYAALRHLIGDVVIADLPGRPFPFSVWQNDDNRMRLFR